MRENDTSVCLLSVLNTYWKGTISSQNHGEKNGALLNIVRLVRDWSLFMAGGGTEEKCFSWWKFC
jgi:hypothetical protein